MQKEHRVQIALHFTLFQVYQGTIMTQLNIIIIMLSITNIAIVSAGLSKLPRAPKDDVKDDISSLSSQLVEDNEETKLVKSRLKKVVTAVDKPDADIGKYTSVVKVIGSSLEKLQSGDTTTVIVGCLDIMEGLSGTISQLSGFGPVFGLLSSLFGLLKGKQVRKSVDVIIKEALEAQYVRELEAEAFGLKRLFDMSKAFLDGVREGDTELQPWEVASLSANFPVYKGVQFMAILGKYIKNIKPDNMMKVKRAIRLIEGYCKLCALRKILLYDLFTIISAANNSANIARGIYKIYQMSDEEFREPLVNLTRGDDRQRFEFLMNLYPKERSPALFKLFEVIKVPDLPGYRDFSGNYRLTSFAFPKYNVGRGYTMKYYIGGTSKRSITTLTRLSDGYYKMVTADNRMVGLVEKSHRPYVGEITELKKASHLHLLPFKDGGKSFFLMRFFGHGSFNFFLRMEQRGGLRLNLVDYGVDNDYVKWKLEKVENSIKGGTM